MTSSPERFLTPKQVGRLLQMDASTILRWVHGGMLPAYRTPGGHRRINPSELLHFLRAHQMYVPPELEQRRRLLLVHDDPRELAALVRALEPHRDTVEVHTCADAIEALLRFGELRPDVLVFAGRPLIDPKEIDVRLRRNPGTAGVHVLVLPAGAEVVRRETLLEAAVGRPSEPLKRRA